LSHSAPRSGYFVFAEICHGPERPPIEAHLPLGPGGIGETTMFFAPSPCLMMVESQSPPIHIAPLPFANSPAEASLPTALDSSFK